MDSEDHDHRCRLWKVVDQLVADTIFIRLFPDPALTNRGTTTFNILGTRNACPRCQRIYSYGTGMPIFSIRHATTYHYHQPVAFGEHRMMLRPRDDDDQKVLESELEITPKPRQLAWARDIFGNHVATAHFVDQAAELRFVSNIRIDIRRPAFAKPISRILPATSRLPTRRKIGPVSNVSSCHRPGVPHLIVGARLSSARTDLPTRTSCSST